MVKYNQTIYPQFTGKLFACCRPFRGFGAKRVNTIIEWILSVILPSSHWFFEDLDYQSLYQAFIKPFETPQRSKKKFMLIFSHCSESKPEKLMQNKWVLLFEEKIMFRSWDIYIFVFLVNPQISKSVTPL